MTFICSTIGKNMSHALLCTEIGERVALLNSRIAYCFNRARDCDVFEIIHKGIPLDTFFLAHRIKIAEFYFPFYFLQTNKEH